MSSRNQREQNEPEDVEPLNDEGEDGGDRELAFLRRNGERASG